MARHSYDRNAPAHDEPLDPIPCFATDAEIAAAERLRTQLEERHLGLMSSPARLPPRPTVDL